MREYFDYNYVLMINKNSFFFLIFSIYFDELDSGSSHNFKM